MKGKGNTDETLKQSELVAQGQLAIQAANKIHIDVKDINAQTVSQTVDAMVKADPNLAWIKQAEAQGDIDWRQVKEIHDSFKYSHSGLGAGAQLVLAIVMAAFVGPAALGALTTAGAGTAIAAGGAAVATSAATTATSSFISNRGNLGGVFKDTFSGDAMRGYVVSGVTAGLTAGVYDSWTGTQTSPSTVAGTSGNGSSLLSNSGRVTGASLNTWSGIGRFAANQALQNTTSAVLSKLLGQQGDLGDALRNGLASTFAAAGFNLVGNIGFKNQYAPGSVQMVGLHALMGGLAAVAAGGDFKAGALAAGASEALVTTLDNQFSSLDDAKRQNLLTMTSQLVGVAAAAVVDKGDGQALQTGASVAQSGVQYNYLNDHEMQMLDKDLQGCEAKGTCDAVLKTYYALHQANEAELQKTCGAGATPACKKLALDIYNATYKYQEQGYGSELTGDASKIFTAYRQLNLEAQNTASGLIALPSAEAFVEALGTDPKSVAGQAIVASFAAIVAGKAIHGVISGAKATRTAIGNTERGVLTEANFAQNRIKSDRSFSPDGQKIYSDLAGQPIRTVDDLADALKAGTIKPNQLPIDYVDMNGTRLILNTRTSTALEQAGIPRSQWFGRNQTGVEAYPGKTFNDLAADQLKNNKLPPTGADKLKSVHL